MIFRKVSVLGIIIALWGASLFASFNQLNISGFGRQNNQSASAMAVYNGQLYCGVSHLSKNQVWHTANGYDWVCSSSNGFDGSNDALIKSLCVFSNKIFAGTARRVWKSSNGNTWSASGGSPLGDMNNNNIELCEFKGFLYGGTFNTIKGCQIWRTSDGVAWNFSITNGFGNPSNYEICFLAVFNNSLFAGVANSAQGFQIWSSSDGMNWVRTVSNAMGLGTFSQLFAARTYGGNLYFSTGLSGNVYRSADGLNWTQVTANGFGSWNPLVSFGVYSNRLYAGGSHGIGCMLFKSSTGDPDSWTNVIQYGFGNLNNQTIPSMAVFTNSLFCGTANNNDGCQIWGDEKFEVGVSKNVDLLGGNVLQGSNLVTVLAVNMNDALGHALTNVRLTNYGTMLNNTDVTNIRLWNDINGNYSYDAGDSLRAAARWNSLASVWEFSGLNLLGNNNYVITIDIPATAVGMRTFQAGIKKNFIKCSTQGANILGVRNHNLFSAGPHSTVLVKNVDTTAANICPGTNHEVLSFRINDTAYYPMTHIKVRNAGTMLSNEANYLELFYDNTNVGTRDNADASLGQLWWNSMDHIWSANFGAVDANRNLLLVLHPAGNSIPGHTFIARIGNGDITLSTGATNTNSIQNSNAVTIINEVIPYKRSDLGSINVAAGSNNITVMAFSASNILRNRQLVDYRISNLGTMQPGVEISAVKLWWDSNANGMFDGGDVQIGPDAAWNPSTGSWEVLNQWRMPNTPMIVTINISALPRNGKTFKAFINHGGIDNNNNVASFLQITNNGTVTIQGSPHWVAAKTNQLKRHSVHPAETNLPVLAFQFLDSVSSSTLRNLRISNIGTMNPSDIITLKVWQDLGTVGAYDSGTDILMGILKLQSGSSWTNNSLNILESANVLITMDASATIPVGGTFSACTVSTSDIRCSEGKSSLICITNNPPIISAKPYVHNLTRNTWYADIRSSLLDCYSENVIEVYPSVYTDWYADIGHPASNVTIQARDWVLNGNNTTTVLDALGHGGFNINAGQGLTIIGFTITNAVYYGIGASPSFPSVIKHNIFSRLGTGIMLAGAKGLLIESNVIRQCGNGIFSVNYGNYPSYNVIIRNNAISYSTNYIYNNGDAVFLRYSTNFIVEKNTFTNNKGRGINIRSSAGICRQNSISGSLSGIEFETVNNLVIASNNISHNGRAIQHVGYPSTIESFNVRIEGNNISFSTQKQYDSSSAVEIDGITNLKLERNVIFSNAVIGLSFDKNILGSVQYNNVFGNSNGVVFMANENVNVLFSHNNADNNRNMNFMSALVVNATNNWWGSTIEANMKVSGSPGIVPYRLFGRFNQTPGADITPIPVIQGLTAQTQAGGIRLIWKKAQNPSFRPWILCVIPFTGVQAIPPLRSFPVRM
jgi:parallel beta-helix repeat protein